MIFSSIFAILVGALMVIQWTLTIVRGQIAGPEDGSAGRGRIEMTYHLVAEFATAVLLIVAGTGLLSSMPWGTTVFFVASGMLIYTVINSPGYFAQQGNRPMVIMFAVILVLAMVSLFLVV